VGGNAAPERLTKSLVSSFVKKIGRSKPSFDVAR
jgi:hypothetical protein